MIDIQAMIQRQARAWMEENIELALPDFAPNGVFISPGGRWQGHEQIRRAAEEFFAVATDVQIDIVRLFFTNGQGAVEWIWHETHREDGSRHRAEDAIIFEIDNDRIVYWREYFDTAQMT